MHGHVKTYAKIGVILVAVLIVLGYSYGRTRDIVAGPRIEVMAPKVETPVSNSLIQIEGRATNVAFLTLNGREIFTDEMGYFKETVLLSYGYNILTIYARDKFGRGVEKTIELVYN